MNCGFMIKFIYEKYLNLLWILWCMIELSLQVSSNYRFGLATRLIFLVMGEVFSFGFNLAVSLPSDRRGSKACIVLLPSRITRWGFYHIAWIYPSTSCHLAYGVTLFLFNTLDACWIAVDEWSNSSRCRIVSVYLSRTWCLYTWSYLDILITSVGKGNA